MCRTGRCFELNSDRLLPPLRRTRGPSRRDDLTPAVRVLAHELTHVFQDQWFETVLGGPDDLQGRAVLEADAMRIENAYLDTLPGTDRDTAMEDNSADDIELAAFDEIAWALVDQRQDLPISRGPGC